MLLRKEKSSQVQRSSLRSSERSERKKSLIKVPSTSKIPRDFFRQPSVKKVVVSDKNRLQNSLEFTFMAPIKEPQLKSSMSA